MGAGGEVVVGTAVADNFSRVSANASKVGRVLTTHILHIVIVIVTNQYHQNLTPYITLSSSSSPHYQVLRRLLPLSNITIPLL